MSFPLPIFSPFTYVPALPPVPVVGYPPLPPLPPLPPDPLSLPPLPVYQPPLPPLPVYQPPLPPIPQGRPLLHPLNSGMPSYDFLLIPVQSQPPTNVNAGVQTKLNPLKRSHEETIPKTATLAAATLSGQQKEKDAKEDLAKSAHAAKPRLPAAAASATVCIETAAVAADAAAKAAEDDLLDGTGSGIDTLSIPGTKKYRKTPSPAGMSLTASASPSPNGLPPAAVGAAGSVFFTFQLAKANRKQAADGLPLFESEEQFFGAFGRIAALSTFEERIGAFQKLLGPIAGEEHGAWILLQSDTDPAQEIYLKVVFNPGPYFSKAFDPKCFPDSIGSQHYHLEMYECIGPIKSLTFHEPILRIRASKQQGELVWLGSGRAVKGSETGGFFKHFHKLLGIRIYFYDDAKITMDCLENKKQILTIMKASLLELKAAYKEADALESTRRLDVSRKLIDDADKMSFKIWLRLSHAIGRADQKTWYERMLGAKVATCDQWLMGNTEGILRPYPGEEISGEKFITQDPQSYRAAVDVIRNFTLSKLVAFHPKNAAMKKKLSIIVQRVLNRESDAKFSLSTCDNTLHDLERLGSQRVQNAKPDAKKEAQGDQFYIHKTVFLLPERNALKEISADEETYRSALEIFDGSPVFYMDPANS
jgi:hypothetical protein